MNRFHVHVQVKDLESSVGFYSTLFGHEPAVLKADYAKWMLEDPRVNFAITSGATNSAIDHMGLQVESNDELGAIANRLTKAGESIRQQNNATCCYAKGDKGWVTDPNGISWEMFHTFGDSTLYGSDVRPIEPMTEAREATSSCSPALSTKSTACCGASKTA